MNWFLPPSSYSPPRTTTIPERHRATKEWFEPVEVRDWIDALVNEQLSRGPD